MFLCDVPKFPVHKWVPNILYEVHAYEWFSQRFQ